MQLISCYISEITALEVQQLPAMPDKEVDVSAGGVIFHGILGQKEDVLPVALM